MTKSVTIFNKNKLPKHIVLRNGIYYHRINQKLPNGKYKAIRHSLHTNNLIEAIQNIKNIAEPNIPVNAINQADLYEIVRNCIDSIMSTMPNNSQQEKHLENIPRHSIGEMIEKMLVHGNNVMEFQYIKRNALTHMLESVGLNNNDDYMLINNRETIDKIFNYICNKDFTNNSKRKWIRFVKELVTFAHTYDSRFYKLDILAGMPKLKRTPLCEKKPHMPFTSEQLAELFNPNHKFFNSHPEEFLACLVGIYFMARSNAACSLQYGDIISDASIPYIYFRPNHPLKKLKTEQTERKAAIPQELLDFGFCELIHKKQILTESKDTDFIFERFTSLKSPDKKFYAKFFDFLKELNISSKDRLDFHSFRNTTSNLLKREGVEISIINSIGGWQGTSMVEKCYSKHRLEELKPAVDKIKYPELNLDYWKPLIHKAYLKQSGRKQGNQ